MRCGHQCGRDVPHHPGHQIRGGLWQGQEATLRPRHRRVLLPCHLGLPGLRRSAGGPRGPDRARPLLQVGCPRVLPGDIGTGLHPPRRRGVPHPPETVPWGRSTSLSRWLQLLRFLTMLLLKSGLRWALCFCSVFFDSWVVRVLYIRSSSEATSSSNVSFQSVCRYFCNSFIAVLFNVVLTKRRKYTKKTSKK